ncbi:hypothetical protein [Mesoterricola silvestris]|uniref:Uncharacterized protein n=1 Tax=Mesoterricola silvestris TaxID=2927979 RepID=A0AA48GR22_9BACT|nr:hypothetical protein [Mesoterricola silvestris]BDU74549.1 hypothetical protein METEAL_37230 [Mesoterricola silvestris]
MDPIHRRRRWYYALWSALLALSAGALVLWERPVRTDLASLQLALTVREAPAGSRLQAWAGPRKRWPGAAWSGQGAFADVALTPAGEAPLPLLHIPIARRRWVQDYIPRGTWDLVAMKVTPPSGPPRYYLLPISIDIRSGLLRPKHRLITSINTTWNYLGVDAEPPIRVP